MLAVLARSTANRSRVFESGSGSPWRAAIVISLASLVKSWPRFASVAPFWRLMVDHLECPDKAPLDCAYTRGHQHDSPAQTSRSERTMPARTGRHPPIAG